MPKFNYSTPAQLGQLLRERYRNASGPRLANMSTWFLTRTNAELANWFGIPVGQVTALRNRMNAKVTARNSLRSQAGE